MTTNQPRTANPDTLRVAERLGRHAYENDLPLRAPSANAALMNLIGTDTPVGEPRTVALMTAYTRGWDAAADAACAALLET